MFTRPYMVFLFLTTILSAAFASAQNTDNAPPPHATTNDEFSSKPFIRKDRGDHRRIANFGNTFTLSAGWGAFAGARFTSSHPGFSRQATARFATGRNLWVNATYRNQATGVSELFTTDFETNRPLTITRKHHVEEYSLMLGRCLNPQELPRSLVTTELGLTYIRRKSATSAPGTPSSSVSHGNLGIAAQFGALLAVGDHWVIDLQARIGLKPALFEDDTGGTLFAVHAGIGWVHW